jgi:hypothetical protein
MKRTIEHAEKSENDVVIIGESPIEGFYFDSDFLGSATYLKRKAPVIVVSDDEDDLPVAGPSLPVPSLKRKATVISTSKIDKYTPSEIVAHNGVDYYVSESGKGYLEKMANSGFSPESLVEATCSNCLLPMDWKARGRIQSVKDKKGKFVRWRYASYHAGGCLAKGVNYNPDNKHNAIEVLIPTHIISPISNPHSHQK